MAKKTRHNIVVNTLSPPFHWFWKMRSTCSEFSVVIWSLLRLPFHPDLPCRLVDFTCVVTILNLALTMLTGRCHLWLDYLSVSLHRTARHEWHTATRFSEFAALIINLNVRGQTHVVENNFLISLNKTLSNITSICFL